jgi:hypothetical protein
MAETEIGALFHVVHVAPRLGQLVGVVPRAVRRAVLHGAELQRGGAARGVAGLIGDDYVVEPMTPPRGAGGLYERLRAHGVRVNGGGGGALEAAPAGLFAPIYAHPRDAHCQLEFLSVGDEGYMRTDPWHEARFSARYWCEEQPLGIVRTSQITVVVRELERPVQLYEQALRARRIHAGRDEARGTESVYFAVGPQSVVELARPVGAGLAQADLEAHGRACTR